jgi:hypothetical protein
MKYASMSKGTLFLLAALTLLVVMGAQAADGDFVWAKAMGGTGPDWGDGMAVDSAGNVYTTGFFEGTVDFDPGAGVFNLTSAGGYDIFVSKLDSTGNFVWAKCMGGTNGDYGTGIAVDSAGNVYTTGDFTGTADFDPGAVVFNLTSAGGYDIFVSKLDSTGNALWAKRMGGTGDDYGTGIAVDSAGNVHMMTTRLPALGYGAGVHPGRTATGHPSLGRAKPTLHPVGYRAGGHQQRRRTRVGVGTIPLLLRHRRAQWLRMEPNLQIRANAAGHP